MHCCYVFVLLWYVAIVKMLPGLGLNKEENIFYLIEHQGQTNISKGRRGKALMLFSWMR